MKKEIYIIAMQYNEKKEEKKKIVHKIHLLNKYAQSKIVKTTTQVNNFKT